MRNRNAAAILAIILGWAGVHRFYLGQYGLGILYMLLTFTGISFLLGIIDAVVFLRMSDEKFDRKYNSKRGMVPPINPRRMAQGGYPAHSRPGRSYQTSSRLPRNMQTPGRGIQNPFKISGLKKYKDFDLEGAIEDFREGLKLEPNDIALHFNLACAYSLTEQVDLAYKSIDKAVSLGFDDFTKIKSHDDLAYVRIQDRWDGFVANQFRLERAEKPKEKETGRSQPPEVPEVPDDKLLSQLKRLADLRDRGLLSEIEFEVEKRKLSR